MLMKINGLILENVRNYANLEVDFDESRNILVGENAQGKTNLVEAIYMTAFAKSFRTNNASDMIRFGEKTGRSASMWTERRDRKEYQYHFKIRRKEDDSKGREGREEDC